MNKTIRNKRIVDLLKKGYSYRRIARKFRMTYQNVCNIKLKCLGRERIFKQYEIGLLYHPLGYTPNERGVFLLVAYLLRNAVKDYYRKKLKSKELDKIGNCLGLKHLSKVARHNINNRHSLFLTKQ